MSTNGLQKASEGKSVIWIQLTEHPETRERYKERLRGYFEGLLEQVDIPEDARKVRLDRFRDYRLRTIGVEPILPLLEFVCLTNR